MSTGDIVLRPLVAADVVAVDVLADRALSAFGTPAREPAEVRDPARVSWFQERIRHCARTDPDGAWVAEGGDRPVGVALALRRGALWFLSLLAVEPAFQSLGIGRRLLRGEPHRVDLDLLLSSTRLLVSRAGAGYALASDAGPRLLAATDPRTAAELLWACLAEATEAEVGVAHLGGEAQWAIDVVLRAGLSLGMGPSSCERGRLGPLAPYLPNGAFG